MFLRFATVAVVFAAATATAVHAAPPPKPQSGQPADGYFCGMTPATAAKPKPAVQPPVTAMIGGLSPASHTLASETEEHEHGHGGDDKGGGKKQQAGPQGIAPEPFQGQQQQNAVTPQ